MDTRAKGETPVCANEVRLVGRLAAEPVGVTLPSGDQLVTFRVTVDRDGSATRQRVDALECSAWTGRVRRTVGRWRPGDVVEVEGSVRRRFFRTAGGTASRVEIEVLSGRLIRRAPAA